MTPENNSCNAKPKKGCFGGCGLAFLFLTCCTGFFMFGLFVGIPMWFAGSSGGSSTFSGLSTTAPVVVIPVEGVIFDSRSLVKLINKVGDNSSVKAVVLRIDTPGGSVGASEEIYRAVLRLKEKGKVVVASFGNTAASGGYYVACAADEIVTNAGTVTGSIGVIADSIIWADLLAKIGVASQTHASGDLKQVGTPMRPETPAEKALLQGVVSELYEQFFEIVLKSRHTAIAQRTADSADAYLNVATLDGTLQTTAPLIADSRIAAIANEVGATVDTAKLLQKIADGRIVTGRQAVALGLADGLGGMNDAITSAGIRAKLGPNPRYVERKPINKLEDWLSSEAKTFWGKMQYGNANSLMAVMPRLGER